MATGTHLGHELHEGGAMDHCQKSRAEISVKPWWFYKVQLNFFDEVQLYTLCKSMVVQCTNCATIQETTRLNYLAKMSSFTLAPEAYRMFRKSLQLFIVTTFRGTIPKKMSKV